jgi:hypothetical protein
MLATDAQQRASPAIPRPSQRFQAELDANEHELKLYQQQIGELRRQIEVGSRADRPRRRALPERRRLPASSSATSSIARCSSRRGAGGRRAQSGLPGRRGPVLGQARADEDAARRGVPADSRCRSPQRTAELDGEDRRRAPEHRRYQVQLDALDGEARDLVGHVARAQLRLVKRQAAQHRAPRRRRRHRAGVGGSRGGARARAGACRRSARARSSSSTKSSRKSDDDGVEPGQPSK